MRKQYKRRAVVAVAACCGLAVTMFACNSNNNEPPDRTTSTTTASPATQPMLAGLFGPVPEKGGAQLWAENCTRCHYAPPPDRYSDAQWDVVVQHMRLRADLTGAEARQIAEFLKASN